MFPLSPTKEEEESHMTGVFVPVIICERVRALMDQLQLNSLSSDRNKKFICSHKSQEKKVVQTAEGVAPHPLARVDGNIHYQFHTENTGGQVTYRVIPVSDQRREGRGEVGGTVNVVSAANLTGSQLRVIQNSFSDGGSPAGEDDREEARCVYFPASSVSEGTATALSMQTSADHTFTQTAGQFYVMMTPSDALHSASQRTIAPRTHTYTVDELNTQQHEAFNWKMDSPRTPRDERRRAQHNEVERRRRDKINNWIVTLSKIIPDCGIDGTKTGASKGGILSKACDYIGELKQHNQRLQESLRGAERVQMDNELLRQQLEELKSENSLLRAQLEHHGIDMFTAAPAQ
ncbi:upstream stimulatory factor 2 isoform X1 [Megalobrama amblycephala]|uniref:upstream stimulatory factor 2 isoform X1 n=1 Tax=Megalobrama amblycephala TaxID=75352 RepID=UPI0020143AFE|nr:upstream stimulatory factor 2 isoform X1 [Megalobrama amblycephala]